MFDGVHRQPLVFARSNATRRYTEARDVSHLLHFHDALPREHPVWPDQQPEQAPNSVTLREPFAKPRVHGNHILGGHALESVTILLAEDETLLLLDFEDALKEAGFMVLAVTSGKKAVEHLKAAESSIAGIVTDIRFAESPSGWDVARIAREIDPEMPVVYISGDSAPDWASQGVPKSIMIEKPFVMSQMIVAISQLLNDRRAGAAAFE